MINIAFNLILMLIQLNIFQCLYLKHYHYAILENILFKSFNILIICLFVSYKDGNSWKREKKEIESSEVNGCFKT